MNLVYLRYTAAFEVKFIEKMIGVQPKWLYDLQRGLDSIVYVSLTYPLLNSVK